jgi:hypothetical protein
MDSIYNMNFNVPEKKVKKAFATKLPVETINQIKEISIIKKTSQPKVIEFIINEYYKAIKAEECNKKEI